MPTIWEPAGTDEKLNPVISRLFDNALAAIVAETIEPSSAVIFVKFDQATVPEVVLFEAVVGLIVPEFKAAPFCPVVLLIVPVPLIPAEIVAVTFVLPVSHPVSGL